MDSSRLVLVDYATVALSSSPDQPVLEQELQDYEMVGPFVRTEHVVGLLALADAGLARVRVVTAEEGIKPPEWEQLASEVVAMGPEVYLGTVDLSGVCPPQHMGSLGARRQMRLTEFGRLLDPPVDEVGVEYFVLLEEAS